MPFPDLKPDCSHCASLCCVALAFDRPSLFAFDKPAGEPCRHLDPGDACRIHAERAARGFGGCIRYDCHGAGQRVTQDIFAGRVWADEAERREALSRAFPVVETAHRLLVLLAEAEKLPLAEAAASRLTDLAGQIAGAGADGAALARLEGETQAFLGGLRPYVRARPEPERA